MILFFINGKHYDGNIPEKMIKMEITKINIETKNISGDDLDSLDMFWGWSVI